MCRKDKRWAIVPKVCYPFLSFAQSTRGEEDGKERVEDPFGLKLSEDSPTSELLYLVPLHSDMKIIYLFFAVLLLVLQSSLGKRSIKAEETLRGFGFMRAPNNAVQCKQAGGTCSTDHCPPPNTRAFGRCKQGIPCCRTVYD
eukprot:XP_027311183.1 uncharacterized protein LOC110354224 isoform X1 [Anas platyrhynchos]